MTDESATSAFDTGLTSYADEAFSRFLRRAYLASEGLDAVDLNRPVVGIAHTISDYVTCHRDMPQLVKAIERGVLEAGGLPFSFPVMPLGEPLLNPTSMIYRNLAAMETEELIRAQPMNSVVLVGGCDKTVPAQLMGGLSAGRPMLATVSGAMYAGRRDGERIGACTDCRRLWGQHRAGNLQGEELAFAQGELAPTAGTCSVMGTASTMACVTEALGLMLPGGAAPPAPSAARLRHGVATGRAAVALAAPGTPAHRLTKGSFHNALVVLAAIGGSTNAVLHLLAIARRAGIPLSLDDVSTAFAGVPLLVDLRPTGRWFMEHFNADGGVPALMRELKPLLDLSACDARGMPLEESLTLAGARPRRQGGTIASLHAPLGPEGALVVLKGSLAPNGALVKAAAASPELLQHRGRAVVFDSVEHAGRELDRNDTTFDPKDVLVMRNAGPVACGMPEAGSMPLPRPLAAAGIKDMVRISDARMSGTSYGTVILHCSPEAAVGGPLALVKTGDEIELDVSSRRLDLLVDARELSRRREAWKAPGKPERGWKRLYAESVLGAEHGVDLDFM